MPYRERNTFIHRQTRRSLIVHNITLSASVITPKTHSHTCHPVWNVSISEVGFIFGSSPSMSFLQKQTLLRSVTCIASNSLLTVSLSSKSALSRDPGNFRTINRKGILKRNGKGVGRYPPHNFALGQTYWPHKRQSIGVKEFLDIFLYMSFYWWAMHGVQKVLESLKAFIKFLCAIICALLGGESPYFNLILVRDWGHLGLSALRKCNLAGRA